MHEDGRRCQDRLRPKIARLKGKIEKLKEEIVRLNVINAEMMRSEDKQISLTDPDARSIATSLMTSSSSNNSPAMSWPALAAILLHWRC